MIMNNEFVMTQMEQHVFNEFRRALPSKSFTTASCVQEDEWFELKFNIDTKDYLVSIEYVRGNNIKASVDAAVNEFVGEYFPEEFEKRIMKETGLNRPQLLSLYLFLHEYFGRIDAKNGSKRNRNSSDAIADTERTISKSIDSDTGAGDGASSEWVTGTTEATSTGAWEGSTGTITTDGTGVPETIGFDDIGNGPEVLGKNKDWNPSTGTRVSTGYLVRPLGGDEGTMTETDGVLTTKTSTNGGSKGTKGSK